MRAETPDPRGERITRRAPHLAHPPAAFIFDFDETIIDLEPQHTAAYAALCRAMGSDYEAMPESFRKGSGRRIIDDIRDMQAHFRWTQTEREIFALRQTLFDEVCARSELQAMSGVLETIRALQGHGGP
ncbi:MAG: HAD hydrolase-like protein, partial [Acidobacteriota bacterium]|nr:HAD hydrolase-like protein [Acidobacteriota bacterium]